MKTYWDHCMDAFEDTLLRILAFCGIFEIILKSLHHEEDEKNIYWIDGLAIIVTVLLVVNITAYINYKKERQFNILSEESEAGKLVTIIRDGV